MSDAALLNLVLWLPVAGIGALPLMPRGRDDLVRALTLSVVALELLIASWLVVRFDGAVGGLQAETRIAWIRAWGVEYRIGLDGLNVLLVALTTFLGPLVVAGAFTAIITAGKTYTHRPGFQARANQPRTALVKAAQPGIQRKANRSRLFRNHAKHKYHTTTQATHIALALKNSRSLKHSHMAATPATSIRGFCRRSSRGYINHDPSDQRSGKFDPLKP